MGNRTTSEKSCQIEWLSLIHISEPTRLLSISYAVSCLNKKIGHQVEDVGLEGARPALGVAAAADEPGLAEHLEVLGHRLHGHVVGLGELVHGRVSDGEPRHDVAPGRVGQG